MFFKKQPKFDKNDLNSVIQACLADVGEAQKALIKLFFGYAKSICLRYAANEQEGEEILNDGFLKIFNNLSKYDHSQPFKAWLRTIVVNTAIDYYRKNQKYAQTSDLDNVEVTDLSEDVISKISAEEILLHVQKLPPAYRMVFTLYVIEGYNHREIAEMLGIKEGTSKSNLQDARKKLQVMIKNAHPYLHLAYAVNLHKHNEN
ncbi:MAG: RNA polymerase sigma factor [Sphingobacteriales bacterium]|nr:MAG: RNA polymerase sigma factor [Sphingobacteriales bacterium]